MEKAEEGTCVVEKFSQKNLMSVSSRQAFWNILKTGIYKELHSRELLSDAQLAELLSGCQVQL